MPLNISTGKISAAVRAVLYGPEGIGKSTFATWAPKPLFLDVEGGTKHLEVARIDNINGWAHIAGSRSNDGTVTKGIVQELIDDNMGFKTLVIDTIDWLEKMAIEHLCSIHNKDGIEGFGYGKGYTYVQELLTRLLNQLDVLVDSGMHVILLAHSHTRKHEDPGRAGSYDRYELKLSKQVGPIVKEWADLLAFMNYKTLIMEGEKGNVIAGGKERILHFQHTAAWDAKNRHDLPESAPMEWDSIAPAFAYEHKPKETKPQIDISKPKDKASDPEPTQEARKAPREASAPPKNPLTQATQPTRDEELCTAIQRDNCANLWSKCSDKLNYDAAKLKQLWEFYKLPAHPGTWSKLTKSQAAKTIGFLTDKLEAEA